MIYSSKVHQTHGSIPLFFQSCWEHVLFFQKPRRRRDEAGQIQIRLRKGHRGAKGTAGWAQTNTQEATWHEARFCLRCNKLQRTGNFRLTKRLLQSFGGNPYLVVLSLVACFQNGRLVHVGGSVRAQRGAQGLENQLGPTVRPKQQETDGSKDLQVMCWKDHQKMEKAIKGHWNISNWFMPQKVMLVLSNGILEPMKKKELEGTQGNWRFKKLGKEQRQTEAHHLDCWDAGCQAIWSFHHVQPCSF